MQVLFAAFVLILTIVGMLTPGLQPPLGIPHPLAHTAAFFLTSLVLLSSGFISARWLVPCLIALAFGLELAQFVVPSRTPEYNDIICNLAGVMAAWIIAPFLFRPTTA